MTFTEFDHLKNNVGFIVSTPCSTVEVKVKQDFSIFPLMRTCWTSGSLIHFHTYEDSKTSDFGKSLKFQGGAVIVRNSCLAIQKLYNCLLAKLSAKNTFWKSSYRSVGTNSLFSPLNNVDCKIKKKKICFMDFFFYCCTCLHSADGADALCFVSMVTNRVFSHCVVTS